VNTVAFYFSLCPGRTVGNFLEKGALVNEQHLEGFTPLHIAAL